MELNGRLEVADIAIESAARAADSSASGSIKLDYSSPLLEINSGELCLERHFQDLLDAFIPVGIIVFNPESMTAPLYVGGTLLRELGYTKSEFEAFFRNKMKGFIHEGDYEAVLNAVRSAEEKHVRAYEHEFRALKKNGAVVWLYEKCSRIQLDGETSAFLGVYVDVTRRHETEERLRVSEQEMSLAMAQMGKMICVYDVPGRRLTVPGLYSHKAGISTVVHDVPDSILAAGKIHEKSRKTYRDFYAAIQRGEKTGSSDNLMKSADGSWRWERGEFVTIFDAAGAPLRAVIAVEDTTREHEKEAENRALREKESVFRLGADHSDRVIYRYDIPTRTACADSPTAVKLHLSSVIRDMPESVIEKGYIPVESVEDYRRMFRDIHAGVPGGTAKIRMLGATGQLCWIDARYSLLDAGGGRPQTAVLSFRDVTAEHERELIYQRYRQSVACDSAAPCNDVAFFETDLTDGLVEKLGGGMMPSELLDVRQTHEIIVDYIAENFLFKEDREQYRNYLSRERLIALYSDGVRALKDEWRVLAGKTLWVRLEIQLVQDPYSDHIKMYTVLHDITQEKNAVLRIKKQAETDGMTGLYNKATTETLIRQELSESPGPCALLIIDLDGLKRINDSLGHSQGDRAIRLMAEALKAHFRRTDILGRIGGDEYMAYLKGAGSEMELSGVISGLFRKFSLLRIGEDDRIPLRGSVGVALSPAGGESFEELYRKADRALYYVKRNGKNDYAFYSPEMEQDSYQYKGHARMFAAHSPARRLLLSLRKLR